MQKVNALTLIFIMKLLIVNIREDRFVSSLGFVFNLDFIRPHLGYVSLKLRNVTSVKLGVN